MKPPKMVGWYDPKQLATTGWQTFVSTVIGKNADPRLTQASTTDADTMHYDYSLELKKESFRHTTKFTPIEGSQREEIWIDYVADLGDGWNSTYAVASNLAKKSILDDNPCKCPKEIESGAEDFCVFCGKSIKRGEILVFGGDCVYPTASCEEYKSRLIAPYRLAFEKAEEGGPDKDGNGNEGAADLRKNPHIFALPGNHDWYDSLVSFRNFFCTHFFNSRLFAGHWQTRQKRSYFAMKLPHKWWLWGVDFQLTHNVDIEQLEFFQYKIIPKMEEGDKVILCVPVPFWTEEQKYKDIATVKAFPKKETSCVEEENSIDVLERIIRKSGASVRLYLAGDLHHYRRFESADKATHKITAGGGGAFLHPTHDFDFKENPLPGFDLKGEYPSKKECAKLSLRNLWGFIGKNAYFGFVTAILYAILGWLMHGEITRELVNSFPNSLIGFLGRFFSIDFLGRIVRATFYNLIENPPAVLVIALLIAGLIFFTDSKSLKYKVFGGALHGFVHLKAIFLIGWLGYIIGLKLWGNAPAYQTILISLTKLAISLILGYIIGSLIMGWYLFISLWLFKRHSNEAFSALRIEDYKNFLRLHIDKKGRLTIFPLKIEKAGKWDIEGKELAPCSGPELIEAPIKLT